MPVLRAVAAVVAILGTSAVVPPTVAAQTRAPAARGGKPDLTITGFLVAGGESASRGSRCCSSE